ncbi:tetratricopeptide repeat protein [Roseivirga seohaensis]|uniref:tetratricopeptide repeat protein n=1 Tax=Roseivirga seohaensis TaxID=1914963 RepID=UPI003BAC2038
MLRATIYWIISFSFLSLNLFSQQARIDSIRKQIPLLDGNEKIDAINSLTRGLMYTTPDEAMDLSIQAIQLSEETGYSEGKVMAWINQGVIFNQRSSYQEAKDVLNQAKTTSEAIDYQYGLAYSNLSLVAIYIRENNYDKATELSFSGIEAAKKIENIDLEVSNLINIASVKQILKDYSSAEKYLLDAKKLVENHPEIPKIRLGQINGNLGIINTANLDYGIALKYYQEALEVFESTGSQAQVANVLMNIGYAYAQLKDFPNANKYYDRAEKIWIQLNNQRSQAFLFKNRSEMLIEMADFQSAIDYLNKALEKEVFLDLALKSQIYDLLFKAHESLAIYDKALNYFKLHVALEDSIADNKVQQNIEQMTKQFEFEKMKRQQEMNLQQFEIEHLKVVKSRQLILVISIILLLLVVWSMWNRNRLKLKLVINEKEKLLAHQEITLNQHNHESEKEKLVIYAKGLLSKNENLEKNIIELENKLQADEQNSPDINDLISKMHNAINGDRDWAAFVMYFEAVYPNFFSLIENHKKIKLTTSEQRILALLKINLSNKEIAALLNISSDSVIRSKYRLKQKLGFVDSKEMLVFLSNLA